KGGSLLHCFLYSYYDTLPNHRRMMTAITVYLWYVVHLGLPEHDHRNGWWVVFSQWNSARQRQVNTPVQPFWQTNHHHDQGQKESSVLPIEPRWRHYDHSLRDTVLINQDGTWARIGQWVVGQKDWEQTLRFVDGPPSPPMDETATYDIRAHLRSLLTLWSHSKKMRSTGEERDMWQRMLSVESPGIFVGLNRLAPYSGDVYTYYIWNSTHPHPACAGLWMVMAHWWPDPIFGLTHFTVHRIRPDHDQQPVRGIVELYPGPVGQIFINTVGSWARIGYSSPESLDQMTLQWVEDHHIGEGDFDIPGYLSKLVSVMIEVGFLKSSKKERGGAKMMLRP
ncbi:hypothetical protein FB446DRAFT_718421, partial [Lentinula raphanica]